MEELPVKADVKRFTARGTRYEVKDSVVPGLRLRVAATGGKTWTLTYRTATGDHSRFTLGTFPETTLEKARSLATTKREDVKQGGDPQAEKRDARKRAKAAKAATAPKTVEALARECIESLPLRPSTRREWLRLTKAEIAPAFKDRAAKEVTRAEVKEWARKIAKRSGYIANRAFSLLRRVYTWAVTEDLLEASPLVKMSKPFNDEVESERVLTAAELQAIMRALDTLGERAATLRREKESEGPSAAYVDAARLLLLTGVRRSAVVGMKREELEGLDTADPRWIVPGGADGRSKSGRAHVVPLSAPALEIVRRRLAIAEGSCLFPVARLLNGKASTDRPMLWASRFMRELKSEADKANGSPLDAWKIHGFRAALATHSREALKISSEVVGALLGHTPPGAPVTRVYNRAEFLDERRAALVSWAAWLDKVKAGAASKGADVLPMRGRTA